MHDEVEVELDELLYDQIDELEYADIEVDDEENECGMFKHYDVTDDEIDERHLLDVLLLIIDDEVEVDGVQVELDVNE